MIFFFFFKQKTAYEMRISDWSSDVCSSDLLKEHWKLVALGLALLVAIAFIVVSVISDSSDAAWPKQKTGGPIVEQGVVDVDLSDPPQQAWEIGRASCRERVCQYV